MIRPASLSITDTVKLDHQPVATLVDCAIDGVALFELLAVNSPTDLMPYLNLTVVTEDSQVITPLYKADETHRALVHAHAAAERYIAQVFEWLQQAQTTARESSDPAITREVAAINDGSHSRYRLLARPDAQKARAPALPRRGLQPYVYGLFQDVCAIPLIASATLFLIEDIGLVHIACNELIFRRQARQADERGDLRDRPVKLAIHPDYVCWDDDDNMYQLPGWPDWADAASWFDNLPLESQLHVMQISEPDEHWRLVADGSRYATSDVVLLLPEYPSPRCLLHTDYAWHWHQGNIFVGVHRKAPAKLSGSVRAIIERHQLVRVSASSVPSSIRGRSVRRGDA